MAFALVSLVVERSAFAQSPAVGTLVQVITAAPIYVLPDATRQPLRVAQVGSLLRVAQDAAPAAGWTYVQFSDPDFERRFGYIQSTSVHAQAAALPEPIDLSVPDARQPPPSVPRPARDRALTLATVRKAYIVVVDDLNSADHLVASCLGERLHTITPIEAVSTKEEADVIFKVKAHIPGSAKRYLGNMGRGTPSANLAVELPDGTPLWSDGAKNKTGSGAIGAARAKDSIACGLAGRLANTLLDAMREARGK